MIGSGIAGLMASRVLADHFSEVIVCERDARPDRLESRTGAPQGDHVHALIRRGQLIVERFFPGLDEELVAEGAIRGGDVGTQLRVYMRGAWGKTCHVGIGMQQQSRPLLEYCLRRRVESLPNVAIRYNAAVAELLTNAADTRVTGVRVRAAGGGRGETIHADLVVDASGRGAVSLRSLKNRAVSLPREDIVALHFGCVSAMFEIPAGFEADWSSLLIRSDSPGSHLAFLQVVEDGRWLVSFGGRGPPLIEPNEESFRAFARGFPLKIIDDLISRAKLVGAVKRYRFAASLHRRFDLLEAHPEGLLVLGEAVCSINPVYGQGMGMAALQVEALAGCLATRGGARLRGLWRELYPRIHAAMSVSWNQALAVDMLHETTRIERPRGFALRRTFLLWAQKLSLRDPALRERLLRIGNLVPRPGDAVSLPTLIKAQMRIWLTGARAGAAPTYRFTTQ